MFSKSFLEVKANKTEVTFKDVAGILEEKKELLEIVDFLKQPKKYTSVGARIPKGVLLYGPPGTGKTLLAKAVSGEAGVSFISANGSSFEEVYAGLGASRIRGLFGAARKMAPCIIFIDEIDSLGSTRGSNGGGPVGDQTLNQFLAELDGFEARDGVILIGATNRMNVLDPALLRSGRLDRKIQVPLPDVKEREAILNVHARKKNISKEVSMKEIAERTPGLSGAELENSLNEAALIAVRQNKKKIDVEDIEEGIDRVFGGPAKKSRVVNNKTRLIVAIHEAGHSVVGLVLEGAMQVHKVTIIPRGSAGGYTVSTPKEEGMINTKEMLLEKITGFLGGRAAEEFVFGKDNITTGAYDDFMKASQIARSMVEKFGMSKSGVRFFDSERRK
nr:ATP-dependent zinc metalloprotease FtsH-like [Lytechinus pictus]